MCSLHTETSYHSCCVRNIVCMLNAIALPAQTIRNKLISNPACPIIKLIYMSKTSRSSTDNNHMVQNQSSAATRWCDRWQGKQTAFHNHDIQLICVTDMRLNLFSPSWLIFSHSRTLSALNMLTQASAHNSQLRFGWGPCPGYRIVLAKDLLVF